MADSVLEKIESAFSLSLEGDISQLSLVLQNEKQSYFKITALGKQALEEYIERKYDLYELTKIIINELQKIDMPIDGLSINDLLSWSKSLLYARVFYASKNIDVSNGYINNRKRAGAGYFEEALLHKAFFKLSEKLKKSVATMTGSSKIQQNKNKVDSVFDEYINFFSTTEKELSSSFTESIDPDNPTILKNGFGLQSKLKHTPWDLQSFNTKNQVKSFSLTHNASLYKDWQDQRSWIKGVIFLEKKVCEAMGNNVGYMLGSKFYWTYQLISKFHKNQYYLAFNFVYNKETKGYDSTSTIAWEQIRRIK